MFAVGFGIEWEQLPDGLLIAIRGGRPWMVALAFALVFASGAALGTRLGYRLGRVGARVARTPKTP